MTTEMERRRDDQPRRRETSNLQRPTGELFGHDESIMSVQSEIVLRLHRWLEHRQESRRRALARLVVATYRNGRDVQMPVYSGALQRRADAARRLPPIRPQCGVSELSRFDPWVCRSGGCSRC